MPTYRLIAYHAQQCAEKHLKAFLVSHGIDFPFTRNISRLLELCAARASWVDQLQEAEELTPYAITARYPGEDHEVSKDEAARAVEIAVQVRQTVRHSLQKKEFEIPEKPEE